MIKYQVLTLLLFTSFLISCSSGDSEHIATYTISQKNFENFVSIDGYVESINSTTLSCPQFVEGAIQYIIDDGVFVEEGDVLCIIEAKELQTFYDELEVRLEGARALLNTTKATLSSEYAMLEAQVKSNEADTKIAQMDSLQLEYSPENQRKIKELDLQRVSIEKNRYEKKLKSLAIIQNSEIRKQELEIQNLERRALSIKEQLDKLIIKSPKKGLATRAIFRRTGKKLQVGDNVWENLPIIIIPEMEKVKVKIMASETDYKLINIGDSVQYTFDAMPNDTAWGKIKQRSPIGQPINFNSKVKEFEIEASLDSASKVPEPGFTANCQIWLKKVADTIVIPQIALFDNDSIKVVYVKKGKKFEKRQVLTGLSSPKETIITTGLNEDETISLTRPSESLIRNTVLLPDSIANPGKSQEPNQIKEIQN